MAQTYRVIDADGHVLEPVDLWHQYMDPAYRDRAPRLFVDHDGKERLRVEDQVIGGPKGLGHIGAIGARQGAVSDNIRYVEGRKGGFDPHERIKDMNLDGIDAAFLYPGLGLFMGAAKDPKLAAALCRAYNRWLADYCSPYPDRLFMDRHFEDKACNDSQLRLKPSEYFKRQCWISFEPVEGSLSVLADYIGPEKILWATDYPHPDGFFPGAPDLIAKRSELSEETKRKILAEGAIQF
jgi:predicted TIM-barrel fold metal-dependent hydrolase